MIDCGKYTSSIKDYVEHELGRHINLLVATHIDNDHIDGLVEMLEQIFVIDCIGMAVHEPDFSREVLLRDNALLCDKADFFEKEFVVCVRHGDF